MGPKSQGREFYVCTLPENQAMQKKKRPQLLNTGRDVEPSLSQQEGSSRGSTCMRTPHFSQELRGAPFSLNTSVVNAR